MINSGLRIVLHPIKAIFRICIIILLVTISPYPEEKRNTTCLKKVREIKGRFSSKYYNSFWSITGICCDDKNNLFVADSGLNKILKFDPTGKFLISFGREGQGPGEFLGNAKGGRNLKISFGNDGKIYVMDAGNKRLSIFSVNGSFIRQFVIRDFPYDSAAVNSKGDIYLLSKSGIKLIDCYDFNFKFKTALIGLESHLQFPYDKPSSLIGLRFPTDREVIKLITKNDNLVVISNFSLKAFIFDRNNRKVNEFNIKDDVFVKDFKKRLKEVKQQEKKLKLRFESRSKLGGSFSGFSLPFRAFIDYDENICAVYIKSDYTSQIYRYNLAGTLLGIYQFPEKIDGLYLCSNSSEEFFATQAAKTEIGVYRKKN